MQLQQTAINSCPDHKQNWLDQSTMQLLIAKRSLFSFKLIYRFTILAAVEKLKGVSVHSATPYQGVTHTFVKNSGFGLTLTSPLYKLYTVMSVQINLWIFIHAAGQKSHLQPFQLMSHNRLFSEWGLLTPAPGGEDQTPSVDAQHWASLVPNMSLQKKCVSLMLRYVAGPWQIRSVCRETDQLFLRWWDSTTTSNRSLPLHKLWHSSDPLVTKPAEK